MNQRPPPYHSFTPTNYGYGHHAYQAQQQTTPSTQFTPIQNSISAQHPQGFYYHSNLQQTPIVADGELLRGQNRPAETAAPRKNVQTQPAAGTGSSNSAPISQTAAAETTEVTRYDGDMSMSFQEEHDDQDEQDGQPDTGEPIFQLPPPPELTYASDKELETAMHAWTLEHGYEVVRRASKKNAKGLLYKRYYHCSKHGKMANTGKLTEETRVRVNRKSGRIGCPMSLAVVAVDPSNPAGAWQIRHRKSHHNHGPMEAVALAGHRRRARTGGVEKAVDGLFAIGTPTAQVLSFLQRTNPGGLFTRTDVANMKLKFKRHGTCIDKKDASRDGSPLRQAACVSCREKKVRCDALKPECSTCVTQGRHCSYQGEELHDDDMGPTHTETTTSTVSVPPSVIRPQQNTIPQRRMPVMPPQQEPTRVQEILADLEAFKSSHVKPVKLNLQSSTVEVLAAASCGSGESYRMVPVLEGPEQFSSFRNAVADAAMKENTYEVLIGTKTEPQRPADDSNVEEWNEYIKQLAIFNRRNTALLGALLPKLSMHFRPRVQHVQKAAEIWSLLEELCQPRGSDVAYKLFLDLHATSMQTCSGLRDYITKLESTWSALNRISNSADDRRTSSQDSWSVAGNSSTIRTSKTSVNFPEDMLCFLFLRNLGPHYSRWADNICRTTNVAGFGTGRRYGFTELTRSALEWEGMHNSNSNR